MTLSEHRDALLDPRGPLTLGHLRLAPRPSMEALQLGSVLFYDNIKMDTNSFGEIFLNLKQHFQHLGINTFIDHRETLRGKNTEKIHILSETLKALKPTAAIISLADMGITPAMITLAIALEKMGIPTVCLCAGPGIKLAKAHAYYRAGTLCLVELHLDHSDSIDHIRNTIKAALPLIIKQLTLPVKDLSPIVSIPHAVDPHDAHPDGFMHTTPSGAWLSASENLDSLYEHFDNAHIGDGLPFIPPTPQRLAAMLQYCPYSAETVLFQDIGPSGTPLRVKEALISAIMAGCKPLYVPIFLATLRAMSQPAYGLTQAVTTSFGGGHFVLVSGPIAQQIQMHGGQGCLGPGFRANATLGRAIHLVLSNVCRNVPGHADLACLSSSAEFSFCMSEDPTLSPWPTMNVEREDINATCVMVLKAEPPHTLLDDTHQSAAALIETIIDCCTTKGSNNHFVAGSLVLVLNPDHAHLLAKAGYSKEGLRQTLHAEARVRKNPHSSQGIVGLPNTINTHSEHFVTRRTSDVHIVVAGGQGGHSAIILPWALYSDPVYETLHLANGKLARDINDYT